MKKLLLIIAALIFTLACVGCASNGNGDSDVQGENNEVEQSGVSNEEAPDAEIVNKIMGSVGTDLEERAKSAGYSLEIRISHYTFELPEGRTLSEREQEQAFDKIFVEVMIYSPAGSATYGNNTVDCDMLRDLQYAVLDAGVFGLTNEDIEKGKSISYSVESNSHRVTIKSGDVQVTILETPFGNSAAVQIGDINNSRIISGCHKNDWTKNYVWEELQE